MSTMINKNKIQAVLIIIALILAICVRPITLAAYYDYNGYITPDFLEMMRNENTYIVVFDPSPGTFTESETLQGMRFVAAGQPLPRSEFPSNPVRESYTFDGWSLNGIRVEGESLNVPDLLTTVEAIWIAYGEAPTQTSPTPVPATSPTPAPAASPAPSPAPTATPAPQSAGSPNPQNPTTNPITISLMIFGAVAMLGIAAFCIVNLSMRHTVAVGKYNRNAMRYKRESRLTSILGVGGKKNDRHKKGE